jgi:uncharacterized membrane protein
MYNYIVNKPKEGGMKRMPSLVTLLSISIVMLAFAMFYLIVFKSPKEVTNEVLFLILGCVSTNLTCIVNYYFGSSKGSADKDGTIHTALMNSTSAIPTPPPPPDKP